MFETNRLPIQSSGDWIAHFRENAANQRLIPWPLGADVTDAELAAIGASLRAWQLGETSDGSRLKGVVQSYAVRNGDPDFVECMALFVREEQRHGELLGRFLDRAGIERKRSDWGDTAFRSIRHIVPSLEVWVTPVVMVETHALLYYRAIRLATRSRTLRAICSQILSDEVVHIRFQCERLAALHAGRSLVGRTITSLVHIALFAGMTLAIWIGHRRALRAGGYSFGRFWSGSWRLMNRAWKRMTPGAYEWKPAVALA